MLQVKSMANKKLYLLVFITMLTIVSCKKKEKSPEPSPEPNPVAAGIRASFSTIKAVSCAGAVVADLGSVSSAILSSSDLISGYPLMGSLIDMGDVSLNGILFKKNYPALNYYGDTTQTLNFPVPQVWTISGSSNISAFTYSNTNAIPIYTGHAAIADSFVIANGISIPLNNYSGADEVIYRFYKNSNSNYHTTTKMPGTIGASIDFTAAELSSIGACTDAVLSVSFYKNNIQDVGGKKCNFRTCYMLSKYGIKFK